MIDIRERQTPVIIIDFHSAQRTAKYIEEAVVFFKGCNPVYFVIDNSCSDDNFILLQNLLNCHIERPVDVDIVCCKTNDNGSIYLLQARANYGFAKSNNIAYRYAKSCFDFDTVVGVGVGIGVGEGVSLKIRGGN